MNSDNCQAIAIVGPTASGKTSLGIALAQEFNGEIISADSRQIYRGMDIGTAKATPGEQALVPHHLIDIRDLDENYTVADFKREATAAIEDVLARRKLPVLVGGTGLYVKALVENLDIPKIEADPALRQQIEREIAEKGLDAVFKKLVALDPEAAYVVDPKNPRRVVRALEVATLTGRPFTAQRKKQAPLYDFLIIGLDPPPDILRERIDRRIDRMMKDGLVDEVSGLVKKFGKNQTAFDAIGYREIIGHLDGKTTLGDAVAAMKLNTWHFAKRQMTWFRKDKNIRWISEKAEAEKLVRRFLR
ncbi:MAG TPA: tRNA (adenosine(37)-N6)-dimethylallyltransferase MiaA [Candidatus Paceibacterota bacterium]|nr:tRNA (adenosine(37)-N6)-dimethylallyltransferase MiaA [Candidatus Paceibacterota bacterium]